MEFKAIANGVNLFINKNPRFKRNFLAVSFFVPLEKETASLNALLPFVLKRGCENFENLQKINLKLSELYGASLEVSVRKAGQVQALTFALSFLNDDYTFGESIFASGCELLFKVITKPALSNGLFSREYVESEKVNLYDKINSIINDKRIYAQHRAVELACGGEGYGVCEYGSVEGVNAATAGTLFGRYKELLKTAPVFIYFDGECESSALEKAAAGYFDFERSPIICGPEILSLSENGEAAESFDVSQGKLVLCLQCGLNAADNDFPALVLANVIFGGSPHSKLFINVREKLSLCYYCSSILEKHTGLMLVSSGIAPENKELAKNEILKNLEAVKNGDISADEFSAAKKTLKNTYRSLADSQPLSMNWYADAFLLAGGDFDPESVSFENYADKIDRLEIEDVKNAVKGISLVLEYFLKGES